MSYQRQQLASGRWQQLLLIEQLANVGSEIERTILWKGRNDEYSRKALECGLELLDLTIADVKNVPRPKELTRLKEALIDYFLGENNFLSSDKLWRSYFSPFNYAARVSH